jgi:hypothetical protein
MEPKKYRKKPVVIEAMQWSGTEQSAGAIISWANKISGGIGFYPAMQWSHAGATTAYLLIATLEGAATVYPGDYIICGVQGEFYPCKPDIFAATYGEVQ